MKVKLMKVLVNLQKKNAKKAPKYKPQWEMIYQWISKDPENIYLH